MKAALGVAVVGLAAQAEMLYDQDGIQLQGTARIVTYEASACRVLEEHHSEAEYEAMKANHGQPLHIWRLDFSAYNGTGKALSHLRAGFEIESKWPPCTNWSDPSGSYSKPVLWAGSFQLLQKPDGMESGEVVRDKVFLLVFHEHRPAFKNWSVNFAFADLTQPSQEPRNASGSAAQQRRDGSPYQFSVEQTCDGQPAGAECWIELANRPGCYVWNPNLRMDQTVTWTGECSGSLAHGEGTLTWVWGSNKRVGTGILRGGKQHGRWVDRQADGHVWDDLLQQGETAEDNGDYKTAEELLSRACGLLAARLPNSTVRSSACMRLVKFHAVRGKLNKADKVLHRLLKTLQPLTSSQPFDIVEALLFRAEVYAAQSRLDSATATLQDVIPLLNELTPLQRSRSLARMSEFYLATSNQVVGTRLLEQAQAGIEAARDFDRAEYVTVATDVAAVLRWYSHRSESIRMLEPIVAHVRIRFAQTFNLIEDMIYANLGAATEYMHALREEGKEQAAEKLNQEIKEWRHKISQRSRTRPFTVKNIGGDVLAPRLVWKREPSYTPGAKYAGVEGTVVLSIEVWPDGRAHNIRVIRRLPFGLSWSAIRAVRKWRFQPGSKLDEPVKVRANVEVNFRLL